MFARKKVKRNQSFLSQVREVIFLLCIVFLIRTFGFGLYQVPTGSMETTMLVGERFFADKFTYLFRNPKQGDIISFNDPLYDYSENTFKRLFQHYVWGPQNWTKRIIGLPGDHVQGKIENGKPVVYVNGKKLNEPYLNKYPLLKILQADPATLKQRFDKELQSRGINPMLVNFDQELRRGMFAEFRSYDPDKSFENQPFYKINPDRVIRNAQGNLVFRNPQTPEPIQYISFLHKNASPDEFDVQLGDNEYWLMGDNRRGSKDSRFIGPVDGDLIHGRILFRILSIDSSQGWLILDILSNPIAFLKKVRWNRCLQFVK